MRRWLRRRGGKRDECFAERRGSVGRGLQGAVMPGGGVEVVFVLVYFEIVVLVLIGVELIIEFAVI